MRFIAAAALLSGCVLARDPAWTQGPPPLEAVRRVPTVTTDGALVLRRDVPIRLMVMREVTTRTAHPGDRFPLHVTEDVSVGGVKLIPAGTPAWGEVVSASESGIAGKSGKLAARLLYVDLPQQKISLRGETMTAGPGGAGMTVGATVGFALLGAGPLGLFARGTNAKLKAGEIILGFTAEEQAIAGTAPNPAAQ